jgi:hypothetical protein
VGDVGESPGAKRRRDRALWCYYCHCHLTHNIPPRLDTDATIEHLNSRTEFPDGRPNLNNTIVIACWKCNHDRAAAEVQALGIERLHALAKRWPREYDSTIEREEAQ